MNMLGLKLIPYLDKDLGQRFQIDCDHVTSHVTVVTTQLPPGDYIPMASTWSLLIDNKLVVYVLHTI